MQQYSLQDIEKTDQAEVPVEVIPEKENPTNASSEVVVSAVNFGTEVVPENTSETSEPEVIELKANRTPTAEEVSVVEETNNVIAEEPETEGQEAEEPEIKVFGIYILSKAQTKERTLTKLMVELID